jgi:predicted Zn-dependent protease with MMP-like domain
MNDWLGRAAPDLDAIEMLARATIADLPPQFAGPAQGILLRIADFAPEDLLEEMDIEDPFELTGLYEWTPSTAPTRSGSSAARSSTNGPSAAT